MPILDELTILIDADASGIEKVLKKTLQTVTGTVDAMNQEEVDWTSIFTRAISPAIIGGIASMFAFAVAQSMQFQEAMNTAGTAAGESTSQIAQTGQAALGVASQTGASANDIAGAMLQVSKVFGDNTQATTDVTQAITELSQIFGGSLADNVSAILPLFKEFGVTTEDQAISMLTSLMHGAQASGESIVDLANQFGQYSMALIAGGATQSSFNGLIATFAGNIQALGLPATQQQFQALAGSVNNGAGAFEILGENTSSVSKAISSGNLNTLLDQISQRVNALGQNSALVGQAFGFSTEAIDAFIVHSKNLPTVDKDVQGVTKNTQTIKQAFDQSGNAVRDFQKILAALTQFADTAFPPIVSIIDNVFEKPFLNALDGLNKWYSTYISDINEIKSGKITLGNLLSGAGSIAENSLLTPAGQSAANSLGGDVAGILNQILTVLKGGAATNNPGKTNNSFTFSFPSAANAESFAQTLYEQFIGTK